MNIAVREAAFLSEAIDFLENPSFLLRLTHTLGKPVDFLQNKLPEAARRRLTSAVDKALSAALKGALITLHADQQPQVDLERAIQNNRQSSLSHTIATAATGAAGGFFGLVSLPFELPLSTTLMLRSIASVAQDWGRDINDRATQLQCLYVFTLGSGHSAARELDSVYLGARLGFEQLIRDAAHFAGSISVRELAHSIEAKSAPVFLRFLNRIASRFEITVGEKILAEGLPVLGALGGAFINAAFCDYFTTAARYHFGLMYLEDKYGKDTIRSYYQQDLSRAWSSQPPPTRTG